MCVCPCECNNGRVNEERDQRKRLIQFLMGLDECYSNIRGQILLMQPLPSAAKAYNMVRQEEKQREGLLPKPTLSTAFSAQSYRASNYQHNNNSRFNRPSSETVVRRSNFKKGIYCDGCLKEGHTKEECYRVVGYPSGHPMHGEYKPPNRSIGQELKNYRTVNMTMGQESSTQSQSVADSSMNARMDQLQNQLNQVMLLMQNQRDSFHGNTASMTPSHQEGPQQEDCSWHPL